MRIAAFVRLSFALLLSAGAVFAAGNNQLLDYRRTAAGRDGVHVSIPVGAAKADTVYLLGGPDRSDGKFQDDVSRLIPDMEGWFGVDLTLEGPIIWQVDTVNAANLVTPADPLNKAMWCGEILPPCPGETASNPGYRNGYAESLDFLGAAPDPLQPTTVRLTAAVNYDTEVDFDFLGLQVARAEGYETIAAWTGANRDSNGVWQTEFVDETFTVDPADYVGPGNDRIQLRWYGESDGGWSDGDCYWPTEAGLAQVDAIEVYFDDESVSFEDFEGAVFDWDPGLPRHVGDFSQAWARLDDIDPCVWNDTPQVAFIDDGLVVPGVGPTMGSTWTYGPSGYIKNMEGGLAGPDFGLFNEIWSPEIAWPGPGYVGCTFAYDVFAHMGEGTGMYYVWHVRSSDDGGATWDGWDDENYIYYGQGIYVRDEWDVTAKLLPGLTHVQLALGVWEYSVIWEWNSTDSTDGTPAPYFDNVLLCCYAYDGPALSTRALQLAQDNFPEIGDIDYLNLGANHVRFDMAANIARPEHLRNDPGDSITADIKIVRPGAVLTGPPRLYYALDPNPLFKAAERTAAMPNTGYVGGDPVLINGNLVANRYAFDLPDTGFLFPGDVLHYYLWAQDRVGADIGFATLPADLEGFGVFAGEPGFHPLLYDPDFQVHALPSLRGTPGDQPKILFWNDDDNRGSRNEWYYALSGLGLNEGYGYDIYYTNAPSSGVGNGLGGRATHSTINDYDIILYDCGTLSRYTMAPLDYDGDPSNDLALMSLWLDDGDKDLLILGDDFVYSQVALPCEYGGGGPEGQNFVASYLGVNYVQRSVRPLIGDQSTPTVQPVVGNVANFNQNFFAFGGCPVINTFDAVEVFPGVAEKIAEFLDPSGTAGAYNYVAGAYNNVAGSQIIYFPIAFQAWYTPAKAAWPLPARALALEDILVAFGVMPLTVGVGDLPTVPFAAANHPNPFNPSTTVKYSTPYAGKLSIQVYDVRGGLVKTLVERDVPADTAGRVVWNGDDDDGNPVASGVYFARTRVGAHETMLKMALLK